jgi:hypothetical protein
MRAASSVITRVLKESCLTEHEKKLTFVELVVSMPLQPALRNKSANVTQSVSTEVTENMVSCIF